MERMKDAIVDVPGILVGHAQDLQAGTGCTVVTCKQGAVTGVDCRGGAPGTRELTLLNPENVVPVAHAVYIGGGSAFGLAGADGVMQYLEERKIGFDTGFAHVPIVPGAILFDLLIGDAKRRPDKQMGYDACLNMSDSNTEQGTVGAGTGAVVGIAGGGSAVMKGGIGTAGINRNGLILGALIAVNSIGNVVDPVSGEIIAGALGPEGTSFLSILDILSRHPEKAADDFIKHTTIGVVATNAKLTKAQAKRVAMVAHDGMARTIIPSHTLTDGDTLFCMSAGSIEASLNAVCILAAEAVSRAILKAVKSATSICGVTSYTELSKGKSDQVPGS